MLKKSDEADEQQLEVGREQGAALGRALQAMKQETGGHFAQLRAGDYVVGYAAEHAEGMYRWQGDKLEWEDPADENVHIEVVVADPQDGRFLPGLHVTVTLRAQDGYEMGPHEQPMLWHPWLYHYGRNWTVPNEGPFDLRVHVEPLPLARHDRKNGNRFTEPVEVVFPGVRFETGQKRSPRP